MLNIKGLSVKLEDEDKQILKGVDLSVEAGHAPDAVLRRHGPGLSGSG
ncbi:MAG: Fe-S cluster assembly ATPase SufC, partial [Pseudomonadota bacterium]